MGQPFCAFTPEAVQKGRTWFFLYMYLDSCCGASVAPGTQEGWISSVWGSQQEAPRRLALEPCLAAGREQVKVGKGRPGQREQYVQSLGVVDGCLTSLEDQEFA